MKYRRCLVPADAFYEWQKLTSGRSTAKQPYAVRAHDGEPFAMAGLWERWHDDQNDEVIESCTILTTDANETVASLHDRMPVILSPDAITTWLDVEHTDAEAAQRILHPALDDLLTAYPVDRRVNKPQNDDPDVLRPIEADDQAGDQIKLF